MTKHPPHHQRHSFQFLESYIIFIGLPLIAAWLSLKGTMFAVLWCLALGGIYFLRKTEKFSLRQEWNGSAVNYKNLKPIVIRFLVCAVFLTGLTLYLVPERFLAFPKERTLLWAMVMVLYPLLSALPQEVLYRTYFFHRYSALFSKKIGHTLIVNGLLFGYAHIVLQNEVAVILSAVGGILFAHTYYKTRSLALVTFEHALYGNFIFTIGLGWYFYGGAWR